MTFFESSSRSNLFVEHDLFRKPVSTFRDHALENLEQRVDIGDVLAAERRPTAHEIDYPAVPHPIVGEPLDPAVLVEIDGHDALVDNALRHEADRSLRALGNVVEGLAIDGRDRRRRAEHDEDLLLG